MSASDDNQLRFDPSNTDGHVESYFWRANHPSRPLAIWLKATVLAPRPSSAVADLWCIVFDGDRDRTWSSRRTVPFAHATFDSDTIEVAGASFDLTRAGAASGEMVDEGGRCAWDLRIQPDGTALGRPLCMFPSRRLISAPFPRSKALTPYSLLNVNGTIEVWGETLEVDAWPGMQGHNWGREHAWQYAWGQCHFQNGLGETFATVEGFSGRLRMVGQTTPFISSMIVRRGDREYRFDRLVDVWNQQATVDDYTWHMQLSSADGDASLMMRARPEQMVCLGYHNPDGRLSYCLNSKLAKVQLRVNPVNEDGFECVSEHGGALELLQNQPDLNFSRVV
jgi:hypothetical protein